MSDASLKLLILAAHPDDAEYHAGALAAIYRSLGHAVRMVSVTDGRSGHHQTPPEELVAIRKGEAAASAAVIGAEYVVWPFPDGSLTASLTVRERIIREIRTFDPDLVLTHRPCDYHPDHRAVGQAVQDASYMVTVPHIAPSAPALRRDPVVAYMVDLFTKPSPLAPDVVLDAGPYFETIVEMLSRHRSQFFEWLPYNQRMEDEIPGDDLSRMAWLRAWCERMLLPRAERFRAELIAAFGARQGADIKFIEAYEVSEYAQAVDTASLRRLFPRCGFSML